MAQEGTRTAPERPAMPEPGDDEERPDGGNSGPPGVDVGEVLGMTEEQMVRDWRATV